MPVYSKPPGRIGANVRYHRRQIAGWKQALLAVALVLAVVGAAGATIGAVRPTPPAAREAQVTVEALEATAARSSLTGDQRAQLDRANATVADVRHWFYDRAAPQLWRIGIGFFVAFILGYAFRQFVGTLAILAAVVFVAAGVAAYFGLVELNGLRASVSRGTGWTMDRIDGMKAGVMSVVSLSLSGTMGFVLGFLRR